ncbi:MAG: hypothetical protein H0U27_14215 [Nitrosopumilus sp.]|nr:hypothetical protein [Nitrosopumilus sp.]
MNRFFTTVFRGYNYNIKNTDILCISDALLEKYKDDKMALSWYLSTEKYNFEQTYTEIIECIIKKYSKVLFCGTSGGGYPALYYASKFNKLCLIGNSQIYLDKYTYFLTLNNILEKNNDKIVYQGNQLSTPSSGKSNSSRQPESGLVLTGKSNSSRQQVTQSGLPATCGTRQESGLALTGKLISTNIENIMTTNLPQLIYLSTNTNDAHHACFKNNFTKILENILK